MIAKDNILRYVLIISFLACMAMANKLWLGSSRLIPEVALVNADFLASNALQYALVGILVLSLLFSFLNRYYTYCIGIAASCFFLLVLDDITRLQSYYYQFMAMLVLLASMHKKSTSQKILVMYVLMAGIYFHSGLSKWNDNFVHFVFPNMLYAFQYISLETWLEFSLKETAYSIPILEITLAALILIPSTRKAGLITAIVLHLAILYVIGPFGLNWNSIVWIWNIAMIAFNVILYLQHEKTKGKVVKPFKLIGFWIALLLFGLLPLLNLIDKWDNYLSFNLYTGTTPNVQLHIDQASQLENIPLFCIEQDTFIDLNVWALQDIQTAIYAEKWVFDHISKQICEKLDCKQVTHFQVYKESIDYIN